MFDPYKAQVTLDAGSSEESDDVDDTAFDSVIAQTAICPEQQRVPPAHAPSYVVMAPAAVDGPAPNASVVVGRQCSPPPCHPEPFTRTQHVAVTSSPAPLMQQRHVSPIPSNFAHSDPYYTKVHNSGLPSNSFSFDTSPHPHFPLPSSDGSTTAVQDDALDDTDDCDEPEELAQAHARGAHFTNAGGCFRMTSGNVHHVLVRFKFSEDVFVVPQVDRGILTVGDLVVVEGDRGENIGQVAQDLSHQYDVNDTSHKGIIRRALNKDRKKYYHARRKDAVASKAAQQLVKELGLKMHVLDAEFQTDLAKLSIYFRALGISGDSIDFRELQRTLFKQFRCRIWLVNWDADETLQRIVSQQLQVLPSTTLQQQAQSAQCANTSPQQEALPTTSIACTSGIQMSVAAPLMNQSTAHHSFQQMHHAAPLPPAALMNAASAQFTPSPMGYGSHPPSAISVSKAAVAPAMGPSKFRTSYANAGLQMACAPTPAAPIHHHGFLPIPNIMHQHRNVTNVVR